MTDAKARAITGNADDNRGPFFIGRRGCRWGEWVFHRRTQNHSGVPAPKSPAPGNELGVPCPAGGRDVQYVRRGASPRNDRGAIIRGA